MFSQYSQLGASILPNALPTEAFTPSKGEIAVANPSDEKGTREWIFARQALQKIANERPNYEASNENYLFSQFGASVLPNVSPTEGFTPSLISQEPPPLRQTQNKKMKHNFCVFCKKNGENASYYLSHTLKDDNGRVICPILYRHSEPKLRISFTKLFRETNNNRVFLQRQIWIVNYYAKRPVKNPQY